LKVLIPIFTVLIFIFSSSSLSAQDIKNYDEEKYYSWFDKQVGLENTSINNGIRYKELYRVKNNKHKFYKNPSFIIGDIIYDDQPYFNIEMKYDLFDDQIIVNLTQETGKSMFQLIKEKVNYFTLDNRNFINIFEKKVNNSSNYLNGFYEILIKNETLILYKKHKKIRIKQLENSIVYSEFKDSNEFYIFSNNDYNIIKSKVDLIRVFPNYKKEINSFYKDNRILLKSDYDLFLINASKYLNNLY